MHLQTDRSKFKGFSSLSPESRQTEFHYSLLFKEVVLYSYVSAVLEGTRKTTKALTQSLFQQSKSGSFVYEPGMETITPWRSIVHELSAVIHKNKVKTNLNYTCPIQFILFFF
jgi:hypothetical protein